MQVCVYQCDCGLLADQVLIPLRAGEMTRTHTTCTRCKAPVVLEEVAVVIDAQDRYNLPTSDGGSLQFLRCM